MSIGPFQNLPGSHEMGGNDALASEAWLLPISDDPKANAPKAENELKLAVRQASRPFWMAANGLGVAMVFALTLQATTGWMSPSHHRGSDIGPVADATPPTIAVQKATFTTSH